MARVLIADDDLSIRDVIKATCELDGHEVRLATDAEGAVAAYLEFQPHLMVLDVNMPGGGCEEVVARLRQQVTGALCPWIVVTGVAGGLDDEERESLGAVAIVGKPFELATLRAAIAAALAPSPPDRPD